MEMRQIPFFQNTRDNLHCFQAALKSLLKFYFPEKNYSFRYLDRVTGHRKGKGTWVSAAALFLSEKNMEVRIIGNFDYKKFAKHGTQYLESYWTDEVYQFQRVYSDFERERKLAKKLVKNRKVILEIRYATLRDIKTLYKNGYILFVPINPWVLERRKGYSSHMVVVTEIKKDTIVFHDPGLPPQKNKETPLKLFLKAMYYPTKESASLIAVRKL